MVDFSVVGSALDTYLKTATVPVFHAGIDREGKRLTLHLTGDGPPRAFAAGVAKAVALAGAHLEVAVRLHDARTIAASRTLDDLVRPFSHHRAVYDPTATVGRARVVVGAVDEARSVLRKDLRGVFLEPVSRILYAVIRPGADRLRAAEVLLDAVDRATARTGSRFNRPPLSVRIVTELPLRPLVPVDRASAKLRPVTSGNRVRGVLAGVAAALGIGGFATVAVAQQPAPAVSGLNAKIDARGGYTQTDGGSNSGASGMAMGAVTAPLGQQFGIQFDGAIGTIDGDLYWGGGGHLFWRNPNTGLLGIYGQHGELKGASVSRLGVEGDAYFGQFTLGGNVGYQWGDRTSTVEVDDGVVAGVSLKFYATDNFMLRGGGGVEAGSAFGRVGFEYQPGFAALPGLSIFADAGGGANDSAYALAGIRYYFGNNKTLIRRHREDDPDTLTGTEFNVWEKRKQPSRVGGSGPGPGPS